MVTEQHRPKRRNLFAESRLLSEWLVANYPGRRWQLQFRVGADPEQVGIAFQDDAERRLARNMNRRVDAVVEPPPDLVVIEATMFRATEKIGRLKEYLLLLPATPDVQPWLEAPLRVVLLTGQDDAVARALADEEGFDYVHYEPAWISDFYAVYPDRRRRAAHSGTVDWLLPHFRESTRQLRASRQRRPRPADA